MVPGLAKTFEEPRSGAGARNWRSLGFKLSALSVTLLAWEVTAAPFRDFWSPQREAYHKKMLKELCWASRVTTWISGELRTGLLISFVGLLSLCKPEIDVLAGGTHLTKSEAPGSRDPAVIQRV